MDKIKILEEIGIKRVSEETHIEEKYINYMVECDFEKLNRINALGFVKILSREYNLDLSDWSEAFEEYWLENNIESGDEGLFIVVEDKKSGKKYFAFILLIAFIVAVSIGFSFFKDKIDFENYTQKDDTPYEQTLDVKEAQKSLAELNDINISLEEEANNEDINSSSVNEELNSTAETISEIEVIENDNSVVEEEIKEDVNETLSIEVEKTSLNFENEAVLTPNSKLWVGVIYLDNQKRRSFLGEGNFSINLDRKQIVTTGHGSFTINTNKEKLEYKRQSPIRFLIEDGNITEIELHKFKELNKGNSW